MHDAIWIVNAPATFQRTMDKGSGHGWSQVSSSTLVWYVYPDDVLVFSRTVEEHLQHLIAASLPTSTRDQAEAQVTELFFF